MQIERISFVVELSDQKNCVKTLTQAMPDYHVGFLEKSYDDSGWWAKYCNWFARINLVHSE
jgi:hypothetical protein